MQNGSMSHNALPSVNQDADVVTKWILMEVISLWCTYTTTALVLHCVN